jgi:hypothetical protein
VPVKSIYGWLGKWDGTWKSLLPKSHRPNRHPKAHIEVEIVLIVSIRREKGYIAPLLMYQELCERGYACSYGGMKPKPYDGGKFPGERVQLDVKYVPRKCLYGEKLYQFTVVDEYSRWSFREIYSAALFLQNLVKAAPFKIMGAQTDNGRTHTIRGQTRDTDTL